MKPNSDRSLDSTFTSDSVKSKSGGEQMPRSGRILLVVVFLLLVSVILTACPPGGGEGGGSEGGIRVLGIKVADIEAKAGLDAETRATIDKATRTIDGINATLAKGIQLGPETRALIEQLNTRIDEFNKTGVLGSEGLNAVADATALISHLVDVVEGGININVGLDKATLKMAEDWGAIINAAPEKWQHSLGILIKSLGVVGSDLSGKIVSDLIKVETKVAGDIQGIGEQVRCTVDYAGQKIDETASTAGPRFVASILPFLGSVYEKNLTIAQIPGVCVITPFQIQLVWKDGVLVPDDVSQVIDISGFNISNENLPKIEIFPEDENKPPYPIPLSAIRTTNYHLAVNLQGGGKDYTKVAPGAVLVIKWSDAVPDLVFRKIILVESPCYSRASFTANTQQGNAPLRVQFIDHSSCNPTTRAWEFIPPGEFGSVGTSDDETPTYDFDIPGVWTVKLTVDNAFHRTDTIVMTDFITVTLPLPPVPAFVADKTVGEVPLDVQFTGESTGNPGSWLWEFSDGQKSTDQSPSVTFSNPGFITVRLTVKDAYNQPGQTEVPSYITVSPPPPPVPDFVADQTVGEGSLNVQFTGQSTGDPVSWLWEFGDGQQSTDRNPKVTFSNVGSYTVRLTVKDKFAQPGVKEKPSYIVVTAPPPPLPTVTPTPEFTSYIIEVHTGCGDDTGTDSPFIIRLVGDHNSWERSLDIPDYEDQSPCSQDIYTYSIPTLGRIQYIEVEIPGEDDWRTDGLAVTDTNTGERYIFSCDGVWVGNDSPGWRIRIPAYGYCDYY